MAALVWFTTGVALWHFTVFLPDRFWGGIVGALLGAVVGAMITGAIAQIATGDRIGETGIETVLFADPRDPARARGDLRHRRPPGSRPARGRGLSRDPIAGDGEQRRGESSVPGGS